MKFISKQGRRLTARLDLRFLIREAETFAPNQKRLPMRTFLCLAWRSEIIFLTREKSVLVCISLYRFTYVGALLLRLFDRTCVYNICTHIHTCECIKYISFDIHIYIIKYKFKCATLYLSAWNFLTYSTLKFQCN